MSKRAAVLVSDLNRVYSDSGPREAQPLWPRCEHSFAIQWETFQEDLHREPGFVDFLVVDDFTSYNLWDDILVKGIQRIGIRPEGYSQGDDDAQRSLPEGKWRMLHAMRPLAADELYARAGVSKPCATKLPAIYCLVHGNGVGTCMFNVQLESAVAFIREKISLFVPANDDAPLSGE